MRLPPSLVFAAVLLFTSSVSATFETARHAATPGDAGGAVPRIVATPVDSASALRLDGDLNEGAWSKAPAITAFVQRDPHEGRPPSHPTEARVLFDREALYVAVRAFDPDPSKIVGILTRRDTESPSDWVSIIVDSYHDHRTAYEFSVNAAGVKADRYRFNDTNEDSGWDAVWDVKVVRDDKGWLARFTIPFSQLRFDPAHADTFGLAITRRIGRLNELSTWPLLSKSATGVVSSLGELTGLTLTGARKRLELVPYGVAQVQTQPSDPGNPFVDARDPGATMGADVKFALTPALTLTGTLNPDFGQVEADPAVVNLSAFETYFNERRPFFMEGSGIFRFNIDCNDGECRGLFYSRRIGRTPRGVPAAPADGYAWSPAQTTIVGAAKMTGRVGAFSVGALTALTSEEFASVYAGGVTTRTVAEPLTGYSVARATREFANQSSLGFMATSTNRHLTEGTGFLPGHAYTGGTDWDWRLGKRYSLSGYWAGSVVRGSEEAITGLQQSAVHAYQRPDADHVELDPTATALGGMSANLNIARIGGNRVRFSNGVWMKTPGFDINDLGFLQRADERGVSNWFQIREDKPSRHLRLWRVNFNHWALWNFAGDRMA
ncbi:MAG: hydrolase, partial [Acidobacteria bacterium]